MSVINCVLDKSIKKNELEIIETVNDCFTVVLDVILGTHTISFKVVDFLSED